MVGDSGTLFDFEAHLDDPARCLEGPDYLRVTLPLKERLCLTTAVPAARVRAGSLARWARSGLRSVSLRAPGLYVCCCLWLSDPLHSGPCLVLASGAGGPWRGRSRDPVGSIFCGNRCLKVVLFPGPPGSFPGPTGREGTRASPQAPVSASGGLPVSHLVFGSCGFRENKIFLYLCDSCEYSPVPPTGWGLGLCVPRHHGIVLSCQSPHPCACLPPPRPRPPRGPPGGFFLCPPALTLARGESSTVRCLEEAHRRLAGVEAWREGWRPVLRRESCPPAPAPLPGLPPGASVWARRVGRGMCRGRLPQGTMRCHVPPNRHRPAPPAAPSSASFLLSRLARVLPQRLFARPWPVGFQRPDTVVSSWREPSPGLHPRGAASLA